MNKVNLIAAFTFFGLTGVVTAVQPQQEAQAAPSKMHIYVANRTSVPVEVKHVAGVDTRGQVKIAEFPLAAGMATSVFIQPFTEDKDLIRFYVRDGQFLTQKAVLKGSYDAENRTVSLEFSAAGEQKNLLLLPLVTIECKFFLKDSILKDHS